MFEKLHEGLGESEAAVHNEITGILNAVLPDNDNFTATDASRWESALGLAVNGSLDLAVRKESIKRKINHPGNVPARQHYLYLEGQLQAAGFDVYVHENKFTGETIAPFGCVCGLAVCGTVNVGVEGIANDFTIIANSITAAGDLGFNYGGYLELRNSVFICGQVFGDYAFVPFNRMQEFRDLVLKIKPAQSIAFLISADYLQDENGDFILDENNEKIIG